MLLVLLSPLVAWLANYLRQKFSIPKLLTLSIVAILTIPSLIIWLSGYTYTGHHGNYVAITLFISALIFVYYYFDNSELGSSARTSMLLFFLIGLFVLLFLFSSIYSQRTDKIFSEANFKNYKATYSRDFDMVLHGPHRVTFKKRNLLGLIERTVFTQVIYNPAQILNNTLCFEDGDDELCYNYQLNTLTEK